MADDNTIELDPGQVATLQEVVYTLIGQRRDALESSLGARELAEESGSVAQIHDTTVASDRLALRKAQALREELLPLFDAWRRSKITDTRPFRLTVERASFELPS